MISAPDRKVAFTSQVRAQREEAKKHRAAGTDMESAVLHEDDLIYPQMRALAAEWPQLMLPVDQQFDVPDSVKGKLMVLLQEQRELEAKNKGKTALRQFAPKVAFMQSQTPSPAKQSSPRYPSMRP